MSKIRLIYTIIAILITTSIVISGCGGECKTDDECASTGLCDVMACQDKMCVTARQLDNCCGNGDCEDSAGETKRTCSDDCGSCTGTEGKYLSKSYDETLDDCALSLKSSVTQQTDTLSSSASGSGAKMTVTTTFKKPFNRDEDTFNIILQLESETGDVEYVKIKKLELEAEQLPQGSSVILSSQNVGKTLWDLDSKITEELIISISSDEKEITFEKLVLNILYDYEVDGEVRAGTAKVSYSKDIEEFEYVNPTISATCEVSECNDGNAGTRDYCGTNMFCQHDPIRGRCGNFICDSNEDKCTCAEDCGKCSGAIGSYMEFSCQGNTCASQLRRGVTLQPKTNIIDKSGDVYFTGTVTFTDPFDIDSSTVDINLGIQSKGEDVSGVTINTVQILEGTTLLGQKTIGNGLDVGGMLPIAATMDLTPLREDSEDSVTVTVNIKYSYSDGEDTEQATLKLSLGKLTLINPS